MGLAAPAAGAAPPGLPANNPNPNAAILPVECEGYGNFLIWLPAGRAFESQLMNNGGHQVGIPIGVDVPVGVQKVPGQGSFDRTVECTLLAGPLAGETIHIMPTGRPTPA